MKPEGSTHHSSNEPTPKLDSSAPSSSNAMLQMILTMADTTWRMFVPILGLLVVGIYVDKKLGVFPLMTLFGFALGILISALLIRKQFRKGTTV